MTGAINALFDTHCHMDVQEFAADRDRVIAEARAAGVNEMLVPAVDRAHWPGLLELCAREPGLYAALGLHPVYLQTHGKDDVAALAASLQDARPAAIGEIGLDYFVEQLDRQQQQALFEAQLCIARDAGLPVVLHVRRAHDAVLSTLRRIRVKGGVAHAFNGSLQQAQQYTDMGFRLGFGGTLTYERAQKIRRLAAELPREAIVLETDAPDIPVASHKGERNSPAYLPECLQALAAVREEAPADLARQTTLNAREVFGLGEGGA